MLAAYQAALNTFVNNRNPQQGGPPPQQQNSSAGQAQSTPAGAQQQQQQQQQQQPHSQQAHPNAVPAAAHQQAGMYAMHAAPMLAYMPVLVSRQTAHYLHDPSMCEALCRHLGHILVANIALCNWVCWLSVKRSANCGQARECCITVIARTFGRVCSLRLVNLQTSPWTADS